MNTPLTLAFIGTGIMGGPMAHHLLNAGHSLRVYNRTREKTEGLVAAGARWFDSPGEAASSADLVFTMLGLPTDVESVYFGERGLLACAPPGALLIDMTTSSPALAMRIAEAARARGLGSLDAPVSGGDAGARAAKLVIMVGGEPGDFERARSLLQCLGQNITLHGPAGAGQHCKMANQIAVALNLVAWCEALTYAGKAGIDSNRVLTSIGGGAAGSWSMLTLAPRALAGNFAPGFYVKHILKDLRIAQENALALGLQLPGLRLAEQLFRDATLRGWQDLGTQALFKFYSEM